MKTTKLLTLLFPLLFLFACSSDDDNPQTTQEQEIQRMLADVRRITANYSDINAGIQAGWNVDLSGCVEHPTEGGMGHHYGRLEYMDGRINHLYPQVLLYNLNEHFEMEFLGVEYIVPFDFVAANEPPPRLFYHDFHANHEQGFWALHVWTEKENPRGIFYDWNPLVSCNFDKQ